MAWHPGVGVPVLCALPCDSFSLYVARWVAKNFVPCFLPCANCFAAVRMPRRETLLESFPSFALQSRSHFPHHASVCKARCLQSSCRGEPTDVSSTRNIHLHLIQACMQLFINSWNARYNAALQYSATRSTQQSKQNAHKYYEWIAGDKRNRCHAKPASILSVQSASHKGKSIRRVCDHPT